MRTIECVATPHLLRRRRRGFGTTEKPSDGLLEMDHLVAEQGLDMGH